jgi:hypothetical protein
MFDTPNDQITRITRDDVFIPLRTLHMRFFASVALSAGLLVTSSFSAHAQTPPTPASGPCLTPEQKQVNDAYYAITRPTSRDDQMPFFDPEYFAGTWDFIARAVDSPLGPGGESAGTLTIKSAGGCKYEGELKGEDPDGKAFTRTITFDFDGTKKQLTWTEVDSRGYTVATAGPVGGELGGLFHYHFGTTAPVKIGGKAVALKGVFEMSSPAYFKIDYQFAVDGGPVGNFGRATFEKQLAGH